MKKAIVWQTSLLVLTLFLLLITTTVGAQAAPRPQPATPDAVLQRIEEIKDTAPTFSDDFSTWDDTWSMSGESTTFMHRGDEEAFSIAVSGSDQVSLSTNATLTEMELTDYLVEVDATQMSGFDGENGYGLIFRYVDERNFYFFSVEGDKFNLVRAVDNEFEALFPLEASTALTTEPAPDNVNHLGVLVEGDHIVLLINGEVVKQVEDSTYGAGAIGLAVGAFAGGAVEVVFDNVTLWELAAAPTVVPTTTLTETATPTATTTTTATTATLPLDVKIIATRLDDIHGAEPTYYDEFRREDGSWDVANAENYAFVYQQRALQLQVQSDNVYTYSINHVVTDLELTDYLVEVDAQAVTMPAGGQYGLVFRYVDDDNFYVFTIRNQEYALLVQTDGIWDAIIDFTTTEQIRTTEDAINRLGVLAEGATLTLLVNDGPLAQVEDTTFSSGGIGLVAATYSEGGLAVGFDNLELWQAAAAPTPTPTAEPTLDEAAIADQLAELYAIDPTFYDEFRRADENWSAATSDGVAFSVQNRAFQFQIEEANTIDWSSNSAITDLGLTDYLVEVDAALIEGPTDGYYGLQFRQTDDANFYRFVISAGAYRLSKVVNDELITLIDWTDTAALTAEEADPAWARLGVMVQGSTITLLINDTPVAQVQDDTFSAGSVTLVAGTFAESGLVVAFDNLELWPLTTEAIAAVTATPVPTPTLSPAPPLDAAAIADRLREIRNAEPTYYDEFRRQSDSWTGVSDENVNYTYQNRTLVMRIATAKWVSWNVNQAILTLNPADFLVEVDTELLAGPESGEYGLVFRYVDNSNFYLYALQAGKYGLWRLQDGEWTTLLDWRETAAIDTSEEAAGTHWARIGVLAEGAQITLLVNDTPVAQVEDSALSAGSIGLAAGALGDGGVEVAFDNLELWLLAADRAPTPTPTLDGAAISAQLDTLRNGEPTYADRLDSANEDWFVGESGNGTYSYDRAYIIEVAGPATVWSTNNTLSAMTVSDYVVEVETEVGDATQNVEHGLIFRYVDNGNFYYFYITGKQYALAKSVDGEFQSILPLTEAATLETGANLLSVWVQGAQITLLINDTPVAQVTDASFATGAIALAVGTAETGPAAVGFENLTFWSLATAVTPTPTPDDGRTDDLGTRLETLRSADPLFSDDFSTWDESWTADADETDFVHDEAAETYQIGVNGASQLSFSQNPTIDDLALTDYLAEVEATFVDGPPSGDHGLLFRVVDNRNFYFFGLSGNTYLLSKLVEGEWTTLIDWTEDLVINGEQGAVNRLGVLVEGDHITLLVNDTVVAQTQDDTFTTGGIALAVSTYDDGGYLAAFDNVNLWATAAPVAGPAVDFVRYDDDAFTLQHPADWTVALQESGRVLVQNVDDEGVAIWPLYSQAEITPEVADLMMQELAAQAAPTAAEWAEPAEWGEGVRRMVGSDATHTTVAAITWVNSPRGAALHFYFIAARKERYATLAPIFAQIVESFTVTGVPAAATNLADLPFVMWEDPDEKAYTVEVPAAWAIKGGLQRVSSLDARPWLLITSPDEAITLMIGADSVPFFIVPSAALAALGYNEGDSYVVGDTEFVLRPYMPGEQFAERFGLEMLGLDACEIGEAQPLPELKAAISEYIRANRLDAYGTRQDVGAITYTCGAGDEVRTGYLLAFTLLDVQQGVEVWQAASVIGYATTPAHLAEAQSLLAQVTASWQLNADWLAQQPETTAADAEQRSAASTHFANLIAAALPESTTSALDPGGLEVATTVTDEATNAAYELLSNTGYEWIDEAGNLVGTQTPVIPAGLHFAEMVQEP